MLGWGELALIIVLGILLLGPDNMQKVARELGRLYAEYKKAKRRIELEILYGIEAPERESLERLEKDIFSEGKISEEVKRVIQENYINEKVERNVIDGDKYDRT